MSTDSFDNNKLVRGRPADVPLMLQDLLAEIDRRRRDGAPAAELMELAADYELLRAGL